MSSPAAPSELHGLFGRLAAARPREIAIVAGPGSRATFARLAETVDRAARELRKEGARPGDTILLDGLTGVPFVAASLAAWALDGVVLPIEASPGAAEFAALTRGLAPALAVTVDRSGGLAARRIPSSARPGLPDGTCLIKITSGSAGRPQGIAVTTRQLVADGERIIKGMGIAPETTNIAAIPISHSYGLGNLMMPLILQGSPVIVVEFPSPERILAAIPREGPVAFPGVPYLFDLLARAPELPRREEPVLCISAGAPLTRRTALSFRERTGWPVRSFYGTSETGGVAYDATPRGDMAERKEGAIGPPLPGVSVALEGEENRVVVASSGVASGYVGGRPGDASAGAGEFLGDRFRTGDTGTLARVDGLEVLALAGRVSGLVNIAGRKVNPREVEIVMLSHPGVREAAVVGVADPSRGERLAAYLVAAGEITREQVLDHARRHLSRHKLPREVFFVDTLPRNRRGKIDTTRLVRATPGG